MKYSPIKPEIKPDKYQVKTSKFFTQTIIADEWECSGNGLKFSLAGKTVAHFLDWRWWKKLTNTN